MRIDKIRAAIVLFFRVPELGRVKKRLERSLGEEATLRIYQALLDRMLQTLANFKAKHPKILLVGAYRGAKLPFKLNSMFDLLHPQKGENLGEDLFEVSIKVLNKDEIDSVVIVGSDCPEIEVDFLELALERLSANQIVISPSPDGGYNLIGLKKEMLPHLKNLFLGIPWGTAKVFHETMKRLSNLSSVEVKIDLLPETIDVDEIEDLKRIKEKGINDIPGAFPS